MNAIVLTKIGNSNTAFQLQEQTIPTPKGGQVLIKVEGFGLNFADVMARKGLYQDAPPLPSVLGYEVVGYVEEAPNSSKFRKGDRVLALTRFGGYAEYAISDERATARIDDSVPVGEATALATQFCTAYYAGVEMVTIHKGDRVLIHSAAGGVGTALVQLAKWRGAEVFATVGSDAKKELLRSEGVDNAINYQTEDFEKVIMNCTNDEGVDVIFDAVGGNYVRKGIRILNSGGRMVCYGAADLSDRNKVSYIWNALKFGLYHPAQFMMKSQSLIGVNMLKIADNKPDTFQRVLENVIALYQNGFFKPVVGKVFSSNQIAEAHDYLESRKSIGKITVVW